MTKTNEALDEELSVTYSQLEQIKSDFASISYRIDDLRGSIKQFCNNEEFVLSTEKSFETGDEIKNTLQYLNSKLYSEKQNAVKYVNYAANGIAFYQRADSELQKASNFFGAIGLDFIFGGFSFGLFFGIGAVCVAGEAIGNFFRNGFTNKGYSESVIRGLVAASENMPGFAYGSLVSSIRKNMSRAGRKNTCKVIGNSKTGVFDEYKKDAVGDEELKVRLEKFIEDYKERKGFSAYGLSAPSNISELIFAMNCIGELGGYDEAVIRIYKTRGNRYTVLIPPTKEDLSDKAKNTMPNDWLSDFYTIDGESALLNSVRDAINEQLKADGVSRKDAEIMIGGFSQGGLTAAAFLSKFKDEYNIEATVSVGAPIEHFSDIPKTNHVVSFAFENDPIVRLDNRRFVKRKNWSVINLSGGWHDAALYAESVFDKDLPEKAKIVNKYLSGDSKYVDFYMVK